MKSILESFAYGDVDVYGEELKRDNHYNDLMETKALCERELRDRLDNQEDRELLGKIIDLQLQASYALGVERFIYGYKLGSRVMVEVLG